MAYKPKKRSLTIAGHRTSISLEDDFWDALKIVAKARGQSLPEVISKIDAGRGQCGLSSAIRSVILAHYRNASS
jgi:predicted DNA-binding ribbon-helix-helix protein